MNEFYHAKFNELFAEFNRYLIQHPNFAENFPDGAEVVLLDKHDARYNRYLLDGLKSNPRDHPVVYVDVGELKPIRSRMQNPKVVSSPSIYLQ